MKMSPITEAVNIQSIVKNSLHGHTHRERENMGICSVGFFTKEVLKLVIQRLGLRSCRSLW